MYSQNSGKLKDAMPVDTIQRIRSILSDMGIIVTEKWFESVNGIYSVLLQSIATRLTSNGKGTSQQYALASGYGEFMERLQNGALYMYKMTLSEEDAFYDGFVYAPDEKAIPPEVLAGSDCKTITDSFSNTRGKTREEMLAEWERIQDYHTENRELISLPFYDISSNKVEYIPVSILFMKYGTNGMSAGNTPEEALVQGVSEIVERYVNFRIVEQQITPPTIPDTVLKRFPSLLDMKRRIEASGSYRIILKDCSLGENWPVVCMILTDTRKTSYFVKFASHPFWPIAVERTLTELMQGRDIRKMVGMTEFQVLDSSKVVQEGNKINIAATGDGYYPMSLFLDKESYPLSDLFVSASADRTPTNTEFLKSMLNNITGRGYHVLIRDVSFLGFPSFYVVVPGISEIDINNEYAIKLAEDRRFVATVVKNIRQASDADLKKLIRIMDKAGWDVDSIMTFALDLKMQKDFRWNKLHYGIFKCNVLIRLGEYGEALETLKKYVSHLEKQGVDPARLGYFRSIMIVLAAMDTKISPEDVREAMGKFFPEKMIEEAFEAIDSPLETMDPFPCYDCDACPYRSACVYPDISRFHRRWKDKYKANMINQADVKNITDRILQAKKVKGVDHAHICCAGYPGIKES